MVKQTRLVGAMRSVAAVTAATAAAVVFPGALPAHAASVGCSTGALITAINNANSGINPILDLEPYCVYVVSSVSSGEDGLPPITDFVTINGNHATIQRSGTTASFRLLDVTVDGDSSGFLSVNNLTVMGGSLTTGGRGGGILVQAGGKLDATANLTIQGNSTTSHGGGLAVDSGATATLTGSLVNDNRATNGNDGGGIRSRGTLTLAGTVVSGNRATGFGGGVSSGGTLNITTSTIRNNTLGGTPAGQDGGGLEVSNTTVVQDSVIRDNSVINGGGGGVYVNSGADFTAQGTTISENTTSTTNTTVSPADGAGILADGLSSVTLDSSHVTGNRIISANGHGAGVLVFASSLTTQNTTTITGNIASGKYSQGGGIWAMGGTANVSLSGTSITGNKVTGTGSFAAGIYNNGGTVSLTGSSVSNNTAPVAPAPGGIWTNVAITSVPGSTITGNIPTNCLFSPAPVTNCSG
ncbi:right-handed parallel beta-helix repeat-containing protein [Streptomyces sp. NPDC086787]|uniref:right-handed parallel beta-helix repeat-containing protein n=1 Tax=Streptomyces sp. NPDC086787 TaxID=3365759 RepID=UPI0038207CC9